MPKPQRLLNFSVNTNSIGMFLILCKTVSANCFFAVAMSCGLPSLQHSTAVCCLNPVIRRRLTLYRNFGRLQKQVTAKTKFKKMINTANVPDFFPSPNYAKDRQKEQQEQIPAKILQQVAKAEVRIETERERNRNENQIIHDDETKRVIRRTIVREIDKTKEAFKEALEKLQKSMPSMEISETKTYSQMETQITITGCEFRVEPCKHICSFIQGHIKVCA
jgi:hypothetical protein